MIITDEGNGKFLIRYEQGEMQRRAQGIAQGTVFYYGGKLYRAREVDSYYNGELSYMVRANPVG